jgi:dephospho-CoA kinase
MLTKGEEEIKFAVVRNKARKKIIGILGGIGSGKSTIAAGFGRLGCAVIDADKIAHEELEEPATKKELLKSFGESIIKGERIDCGRLAEIGFANRQKVALLNRIIHPPVMVRIEQLIEGYNRQADVKAIVVDMPLLTEVGWAKRCDSLIFVECDEKKRLERVERSGFLDKNKIKIREKFQISLDKKRKIAEYIIDNNVELPSVERQIAEIFTKVMENG